MRVISRFPITISLFIVTLSVALALAATIIAYTHYANRTAALTAGRELMERSAEVVRLRTASLIAPIDAIAEYSGDWLDVNAVPKASGHPARKRLISFLSAMPQIANLYIGYDDGSNYLIGAARTFSKEQLEERGAPQETAVLEQVILRGDRKRPIRIERFLDENGETLSSNSDYDITYDPRERPWYQQALDTPNVARTDVYIFASSKEPGLTVSKRHAKGVVGVDITLADIDQFLDSEPQAKIGVLAIINQDGTLLANSSVDASSDADGDRRAALAALRKQALNPDHEEVRTIDVNGHPWITHLSAIELGAGMEENLAIALPLREVVGNITRASQHTIAVSVFITLCSIPLIWLVSRSLSRPLKVLAEGTQQIRDFDLDQPFPRSSVVDEIFKLQTALDQMRTSLQTFGRYVPNALVHQMIQRQETPEPGGKKRDITVLFMDLENFTAMSAQLAPEEVMSRMSRYFEIVTQTLLEHDATIDKYIGDAVMAFWNAPNSVEDHPAKACRAALAVIEACKAETDSWSGEGIPPVRTRIGLHTGEAIVGNVGSSDRLNYTALGDTVNLASRLEAYNRETRTSILISPDLARRIEGSFSIRALGEAQIKGYEDAICVFELLSAEVPD